MSMQGETQQIMRLLGPLPLPAMICPIEQAQRGERLPARLSNDRLGE
jgi:hypothetical protein